MQDLRHYKNFNDSLGSFYGLDITESEYSQLCSEPSVEVLSHIREAPHLTLHLVFVRNEPVLALKYKEVDGIPESFLMCSPVTPQPGMPSW
jgi:hypothetical protein